MHRPPRSWSLIGAMFIMSMSISGEVVAQPVKEGQTKQLAPPLRTAEFKDRGDGVLWRGTVSASGAYYIRVHFSDIKAPVTSAYSVVLRDKNERALVRYSPSDFSANLDFLSDVLFTDTVFVQVEAETPPKGLSFTVDWFVHQVDTVGRLTPNSIVAVWRNIAEAASQLRPTPVAELSRSVAKLHIGDGYACSGFLIASSLLVTNYHCLDKSISFKRSTTAAKASCSDIEVQFDFDLQPSPDKSVRTKCVAVRDSSVELDFALLELRADVGKAGPRRPLRLATRAFEDGPVIVIHHPAGLAKKVSFGCQAYTTSNKGLLEHDCSTLGGSSGAPILSPEGLVVGLHYAGPFQEDATIREINEAIAQGAVFRNKAKPIGQLIERVKTLIPTDKQ